ncbi:MAG: OsmC family protein [Bacteroidales bacterium]|nr:OsmC family protein [Bacteroidales bacterium]
MIISLERINDACHLVATNGDGNVIHIDGAPSVGGENGGFRPMQLMAAGVGSCSSIDIINILKKQRQELKDLKVEIKAEREVDKVPSLFKSIHLHYTLSGKLDNKKVEKAIKLSLEKYCSVIKILEKTSKISYSFNIEN